jgi:hypothetical protein
MCAVCRRAMSARTTCLLRVRVVATVRFGVHARRTQSLLLQHVVVVVEGARALVRTRVCAQGSRLEQHIGSASFAQLVMILIVATSMMMVGVSVVLEEYMHMRRYHLMQQCVIGFTGACAHRHTHTLQAYYLR